MKHKSEVGPEFVRGCLVFDCLSSSVRADDLQPSSGCSCQPTLSSPLLTGEFQMLSEIQRTKQESCKNTLVGTSRTLYFYMELNTQT